MCAIDNLRLRESVGIILHDHGVEFFKTNIREAISLKMNFPDIVNLLKRFDGKTSVKQIAQDYGSIDVQQLATLAKYLKEQFVLIEQDVIYPIDVLQKDLRLVNLLEDYFHSSSEVLNAVKRLKNVTVMIVGLGAVGSYIATYLAKFCVGNLVLVDNDQVELSNLHRQYYFENDIGLKKTDALKKELKNISPDINISIISKFLTKDFFETTNIPCNLNLIINCSDEPNVDVTSRIIATYAMKHKIPHIIGGGYNLHLTLIGQTIIPFESACFECFNTYLTNINEYDLKNVKALYRENRKLGSFAPLSGIAASLAALDAFKILIERYDTLQNVNKRIEFNAQDFSFNFTEIHRDPKCQWCKECNE